jgi:transposase-like protein
MTTTNETGPVTPATPPEKKKRGPKPKLDGEKLQEAVRLMTESDLTVMAICERLGVTAMTLYKSLRRAGYNRFDG